ncbi:unnamed protein product [Brachionus calyciflorus]|uniref:Reverse transcriptase domain-containing protein n=1 Tax=Brachionus calyciflorus TaxID=104777 RepID=A0A814KDG8_9BILA|nr:unnamed protein product [Brachionus calyciflorus]
MAQIVETIDNTDFKLLKDFGSIDEKCVKSEKSSNIPISHVNFNGRLTKDKNELCNVLNRFFTSMSSSSNSTIEQSTNFIDSQFDQYKIQDTEFKFNFTTAKELNDLLKSLTSSSSNDDLNNYRAISILPPIAKLFEKLIHKQILAYLNGKNIITNDQHGFRSNHSCESALHEIISEIKKIKSKRSIGLLLFVDFRKAFDSVDPRLLLLKLKKYGVSIMALYIIKNYFENRSQFFKIDDCVSDSMAINLGVPQGSVLGPRLFLLFINDIVKYLSDFMFKLFADDTTILKVGNELSSVISEFSCSIKKLVEWCKFNRIDINWNKTKIMFLTNKRNICLPKSINVDNNNVEVVNCFKLLGITIDNKLSFQKYVSEIRNSIKFNKLKTLFN